MTAAVHHSDIVRSVVKSGILGDGQPIDVTAQGDDGLGACTAHDGHHAGPESRFEDFNAMRFQNLTDARRGAELFIGEFRMTMEPAVPFLHISVQSIGKCYERRRGCARSGCCCGHRNLLCVTAMTDGCEDVSIPSASFIVSLLPNTPPAPARCRAGRRLCHAAGYVRSAAHNHSRRSREPARPAVRP